MTDAHGGPAVPTADALSAVRPLGLRDVRLDPGGLLGSWQHRNATATLPHCIGQLEDGGAMDNLRRAAGVGDREFRGFWFSDSDIYKTAEAAAWELGRRPNQPVLTGFLDSAAALLAKAQGRDGYLNSYYQTVHPQRRWQELRSSHELYCAGHLIQAAVAAARAGDGADLMAIAGRFADLLVDQFGPSGSGGICGHPEIETALVELYRVSSHEPYLNLARRFVDLRGHGLLGTDSLGLQYYQDHQPVRTAKEVTGHAVRQLYLLAGVVDVAVETGDHTLLAAAELLWDNAFTTKTYLTGAHGSRHRDEAFGDPYELPPDRAYAETCAAIASFQWNWRLLLATGQARYADELERVLYNAIAVATSLDGTHFFYSNPLQLRTGHDGSHEHTPSRRLPWYSCACCPPNLARLMASLQCYVATTDAGGLQLHLYGSGTVRASVSGVEVGVRVRTGYPWHGRVELAVTGDSTRPWTLALRIPAWCTDFRVSIDGQPVEARVEQGYLQLTRAWPSSATPVVLDLDMPARVVTAHPHVDAVRGCVALTRGPLVFCVEQADLPVDITLEEVCLDPTAAVRSLERADLPHIPVTLAATGTVLPAAGPELYRPYRPAGQIRPHRTVAIPAVPYFLWGNRNPGAMRIWIPEVPTPSR